MKTKLFKWLFTHRKLSKGDFDGRSLYGEVLLAPAGTCRWAKRIRAIVDTGNQYPLALPADLIASLGFGELPIISEDTMITSSGESVPINVVAADMKLICLQSTELYALMSVPLAVLPEGTEPLIGLPLLDFYNYVVLGGQLAVLSPNEESFAQLDDIEPTEIMQICRTAEGTKLLRVGTSNVNDRSNEAKPLKPLQRPDLPKRPTHTQQQIPTPPKPPVPPQPPNAPRPPQMPKFVMRVAKKSR